jgi:AraC family transcriptional regulator, positive regulator of tynA and feaB
MLQQLQARGPTRGLVHAWTSQLHPVRERHDAWADALSRFFLPWTVTSRARPDVRAAVQQCQLDDCRYVHCKTGPISGQRGGGDIGRTRGDYFSLLYVMAGSEVLRFEGREVLLPSDHFVLWDSGRRMDFALAQSLEKLTLVIPERQMRALLPNAQDYVGIPVNGAHGMSRLLTDHLRALKREIWRMGADELRRIQAPTLELLARTYASVPCQQRATRREESFQRVQGFILGNLADPQLTPTRIAHANGVSIRYLHLLFESIGTTVAAWIRAQRIERCRLDLANPQLAARSITEIAFRWGFSDAGHFGKVFRRAAGASPRQFRRLALTRTVPG